jgi:hypothetical protein
MITEKNNLHDGDSFSFFKYFLKMWVAVFLVTRTFDITMAIFDVAQHVVNAASALIRGSAYIDINTVLASMLAGLQDKGIAELAALSMETLLVGNAMKLLSVLITVILYGRMIEIFLTCSVAPIPFATLANREWGQMGNNYLRNLAALGFQGFFMMVCVAIYTVLVQSIILTENIHASIFQIAAYTLLLCFSLFKTGSLSKSIFNAIRRKESPLGLCQCAQRPQPGQNQISAQPHPPTTNLLLGSRTDRSSPIPVHPARPWETIWPPC